MEQSGVIHPLNIMCALPTEILQMILSYLSAKDICACSQVCRLWKQAVDGMSDTVWHSLSIKVHGKLGHRTSTSWRQEYKSLTLLSKIRTIKMNKNFLHTKSRFFQVFRNPTPIVAVTYAENGNNECNYNTIIYFDPDTMEEIDREVFAFYFYGYAENNKFIAVVDTEDMLCIVPKSNKRRYLVGKIPECVRTSIAYGGEFFLSQENVYFRNDKNEVCVFEFHEGDYRTRRILSNFKTEILAVCSLRESILTSNGSIYSIDLHMKECTVKDEAFDTLDEFNIDISRKVARWLTTYQISGLGAREFIEQSFCRFGSNSDIFSTATMFSFVADTVLVATKSTLNFYEITKDDLYGYPKKVISLDDFVIPDGREFLTTQMEVALTVNGYRLIMCVNDNVYVLNFSLSDDELGPNKFWSVSEVGTMKEKPVENKKGKNVAKRGKFFSSLWQS